MKSRWQEAYTIMLCCLMIFCSVSLITGCKSKETTPQQFFTILDGNETKIDNILMETSQGREHFEKGRKDCVDLRIKIEEQIKNLDMEGNEKLAEEVKVLYTNESQRLEYMRAMFSNEDDMNNLNRVVKLYKEFETQAKTFIDKYKINDKFTYKKVREEAEHLEKERIRKAKEERAKRIAANRKNIIAYKKFSEGDEKFIPTNSIKIKNGMIYYTMHTRYKVPVDGDITLNTLDVTIDYKNRRTKFGKMSIYDFNNQYVNSIAFPNGWFNFSSPIGARIDAFVEQVELDLPAIEEYLKSIEEWNI